MAPVEHTLQRRD